MNKEEVVDKLLKQYDFVISMHEFHPEVFEILSKNDMQLLIDTFRLDQGISADEVHSLSIHIQAKLKQNPSLLEKLNPIVEYLANELQLTEAMKKDLLS